MTKYRTSVDFRFKRDPGTQWGMELQRSSALLATRLPKYAKGHKRKLLIPKGPIIKHLSRTGKADLALVTQCLAPLALSVDNVLFVILSITTAAPSGTVIFYDLKIAMQKGGIEATSEVVEKIVALLPWISPNTDHEIMPTDLDCHIATSPPTRLCAVSEDDISEWGKHTPVLTKYIGVMIDLVRDNRMFHLREKHANHNYKNHSFFLPGKTLCKSADLIALLYLHTSDVYQPAELHNAVGVFELIPIPKVPCLLLTKVLPWTIGRYRTTGSARRYLSRRVPAIDVLVDPKFSWDNVLSG